MLHDPEENITRLTKAMQYKSILKEFIFHIFFLNILDFVSRMDFYQLLLGEQAKEWFLLSMVTFEFFLDHVD